MPKNDSAKCTRLTEGHNNNLCNPVAEIQEYVIKYNFYTTLKQK